MAYNKWQIFVADHQLAHGPTVRQQQQLNVLRCKDTQYGEVKMCQLEFSKWWRGLWQPSREQNTPYPCHFECCRVTETMKLLRLIEFTLLLLLLFWGHMDSRACTYNTLYTTSEGNLCSPWRWWAFIIIIVLIIYSNIFHSDKFT